jgi:hypothetical protein
MWLSGLGKLKIFNNFIVNRNRDLPACSIVLQPSTLLRILSVVTSTHAIAFGTVSWIATACHSKGYTETSLFYEPHGVTTQQAVLFKFIIHSASLKYASADCCFGERQVKQFRLRRSQAPTSSVTHPTQLRTMLAQRMH